MTVEQFDRFAESQPDTILEYIGGEVYEVPSNPYVSMIAGLILTAFNLYLRTNPIGYVTGEAGGYRIAGDRYAPDVAFISHEKILARRGYNPQAPDLVVEVISDSENHQELNNLRVKISNYLAAGVVTWVVDPDARRVEVHRPGQPVEILDENGTLSGDAILPDFTLPIRDILPVE